MKLEKKIVFVVPLDPTYFWIEDSRWNRVALNGIQKIAFFSVFLHNLKNRKSEKSEIRIFFLFSRFQIFHVNLTTFVFIFYFDVAWCHHETDINIKKIESGQIDMKDPESAESKENQISDFSDFYFRVMVIFLTSSPQFSMKFRDNSKNKDRKYF